MSDANPAKPKREKKAPSKRGGRRAGAGRKPTKVTQTTRELEATVDGLIGAKVPELVENLVHLANGGYQRVVETLEPAASVVREDLVRDKDGTPMVDARGVPLTAKQPAYPDAKPGEMVVTRRVVETADCDRQANEYLLNRRLGKPRQAVELSGPDGAPIPVTIEAALNLIYGEDDEREAAQAELLGSGQFGGDLGP